MIKPQKKTCSAIILSGGKATRMGGIDKTRLEIDGKPIIDRIIETLSPLVHEVIIASGNGERGGPQKGIKVALDENPGVGPLAGILAGLKVCSTPWAFVVAGDMPHLNTSLIARIIKETLMTTDETKAVVPKIGDKLEPLHAVYHRDLVVTIEEIIAKGGRKPRQLFDLAQVKWLELDPSQKDAFANINCPEDLIR